MQTHSSVRTRAARMFVGAAVVVTVAIGGPTTTGAQTNTEAPGRRRPVAPTAPRVQPLPRSAWTEAHTALVQKHARYGEPDNAVGTLLRVPELFDGVMPYTIYLSEDSSLTPRQRELLILRAAWLTGNQALWARHAARARKAGFTDRDLRHVAEGAGDGAVGTSGNSAARGNAATPAWPPLEAALLQMSDQLFANAAVTDATWAALAGSFDLFHLMDAVETFNHFMVLGLIYNTYGVQPDAGAADRLPADVPYVVRVPAREPDLKVARAVAPPGRGIAVGRTFGLYPALSRAWSPRQTFILQKSPVTPRHREMFILRMGWNCRSEYEWAQHVGSVGRAREWGLEPRNIALGPAAPAWTPGEANILKASDEIYTNSVVSDATWNALVREFGEAWTMSGIFSTADYRAISNSLNTYGVQHEPDDERFPVF